MSDTRLAEELGSITLFRNLPPTALARLAEGARRVAPPDGAPLFAQGDASDAVYAVLEGRGRVRVGAPDTAAKRLMVRFSVPATFSARSACWMGRRAAPMHW